MKYPEFPGQDPRTRLEAICSMHPFRRELFAMDSSDNTDNNPPRLSGQISLQIRFVRRDFGLVLEGFGDDNDFNI